MRPHRFHTLLLPLLLLGCGSDDSDVTTLYEGGLDPVASGWSVFSDPLANGPPGSVTIGPQAGADGKGFDVTTDGGAVHYYFFETGADDFALSVEVDVFGNAANPLDFGFGIAPFVGDPSTDFAALDRSFSLVPLADRLVWGDQRGDHYPFDTTGTHEYALRYHNAILSVYIDEPFASVVNGTAIPVMARAVSEPSFSAREGFVGLGDMTNEVNVNSSYQLRVVRFAAIPGQ